MTVVPTNIIPLALAKDKLREIDETLADNYLLIGGIAVNHFVKSRDSHDIDLICTHDQSYKVLEVFRSDEWNITDGNDDPTRPAYVAQNKKDPRVILKFGPKIVERGAYKYLDWDVLAEKRIPLTHQNVPLKHISIPSAAYLAYSKLISFFLRADPAKKMQDLTDFVNLSNSDEFSYTLFISILERLGAAELVRENYLTFMDAYKKSGVTSLLFRLSSIFSEPVSQGRHPGRLLRGSSDFIGRILDAAIYFRDNSPFAIDEIRMAVDNKRIFPVRLLYRTEEGVKSWLDLCESPRYSFYVSSYNHFDSSISHFAELISQMSTGHNIKLISLGVGDGKKERLMIEAFLAKIGTQVNVSYYPIDVSLSMIERTAKHLSLSPDLDRGRLRIKPVVGDFLGIHSMDPIYNHESGPNLFSVLGNTIGNGAEYELFDALRNAARANDLVLLEIDTDQAGAAKSDFVTSHENKRIDLAPLLAAGYRCSESDLQYTIFKDKNPHSLVPQTVSILAECDVRLGDGEGSVGKKARTSVVHHYQLEPFAAAAAERLDMNLLHKSESNGVGLILLHKPS